VHCRADGGGIPWWGRPWAAKITAGCWADWKEPCGRAELRHRGLFDEGCLHFYAGALGDERSDADTELLRNPAWRSWAWPAATGASPTGWPPAAAG
jgi:hypothetical protein